jgi:hypothetical protein
MVTICLTYEDLVASEENLMAHGWNEDFLVAQEKMKMLPIPFLKKAA